MPHGQVVYLLRGDAEGEADQVGGEWIQGVRFGIDHQPFRPGKGLYAGGKLLFGLHQLKAAVVKSLGGEFVFDQSGEVEEGEQARGVCCCRVPAADSRQSLPAPRDRF